MKKSVSPKNTVYSGWPENFPKTTCLVPYVKFRHSPDGEIRELYDRAKNHEDREAANGLLKRLLSDEAVGKIKTIAARNPDAIVVAVHALEGAGKNAIPNSLAAFISRIGNLEADTNIVQSAIVANTGKNSWSRLARRARFEGEVKAGRDYLLVDDVVSAGGTFSELRHFIESGGGRVVDTVAMANGAKGFDATLAVTPSHLLELENKYGVELLQEFLIREDLYDGNHKALTDAEARTLLGAASLDEARDQIAAARQEGINRIRPEVVRRTHENSADEKVEASPESEPPGNPLSPKNTVKKQAVSDKVNSTWKTGFVQGACECANIVKGRDPELAKKLLAAMGITKTTAKKFAYPDTYKEMEKDLYAPKPRRSRGRR